MYVTMVTTCLDLVQTPEILVWLLPGCCRHGVSVHCLCVQILSLYAARWPVLPTCMQLILVSWYVDSMLPLLDVQFERCFAMQSYPSKAWFLWVVVQTSVQHNLFISYWSIFLSWLPLWRWWLHSCWMFILIAEYGSVHRGDCINCETCHFCFDLAFVWPSFGCTDFHSA